jgi:hypothetical protein
MVARSGDDSNLSLAWTRAGDWQGEGDREQADKKVDRSSPRGRVEDEAGAAVEPVFWHRFTTAERLIECGCRASCPDRIRIPSIPLRRYERRGSRLAFAENSMLRYFLFASQKIVWWGRL